MVFDRLSGDQFLKVFSLLDKGALRRPTKMLMTKCVLHFLWDVFFSSRTGPHVRTLSGQLFSVMLKPATDEEQYPASMRVVGLGGAVWLGQGEEKHLFDPSGRLGFWVIVFDRF